jgi:drug/metabolite transporter (DMT)-like permease
MSSDFNNFSKHVVQSLIRRQISFSIVLFLWEALFFSSSTYGPRGAPLDRYVIWAVVVAISLLGAVGNILFKFGTDKLGSIPPQRFLDVSFIFQYLFTPSIFAALVLLFLGRFLTGSPLSVLGVTQAFVIVTVLSLAFTLIFDTVIFRQVYDAWTYVGIMLGLASVVLIARGMTFS